MKTVRSLVFACCAAGLVSLAHAWETEYVILVTGDGIRHQEVFTGVDAELVQPGHKKSSGVDSPDEFRKQYWDEDPIKRREKIMPFFWKELSKKGIILGNREKGSPCVTKNPHHFSYPGYAEILNGQPLDAVNSNDPVFSPRQTILEFVKHEKKLSENKVAAFGSWKIFNWIVMQKDSAFFCNAGYEALSDGIYTPAMRELSDLQFDALSPWDSVRHDFVTAGLALDFIDINKPRLAYVALGETDDWAHGRRYDRTVQTLEYFDEFLKRLWRMLQSHDTYKGKTTVIVTTDHGRGRTKEDWTSHGKDIPGADEVWIGVFGPDTPAVGEAKDTETYSLSNVTPTILTLLDLDVKKFNPDAAAPIAAALKK